MKQKLNGHIFCLPNYSMRDKSAEGQPYAIHMDGNLNILLNRLYSELHKVDCIYLCVPLNSKQQSIDWLVSIGDTMFESKLHLIFIEYGINAAGNREHFTNISADDFEAIQKAAIANGMDTAKTTYVFDFPIFARQLHNVADVDCHYYFPMTALCDEDLQKPHGKYFDRELSLMENTNTKVFLLTQNQFDYAQSKSKETLLATGAYVISECLNTNFTKACAYAVIYAMDACDKVLLKNTLGLAPNALLYFNRIEDERYKFKEVVEQAMSENTCIFVTNPTNFYISEFLVKHKLQAAKLIIDLSQIVKDKRACYLYALACAKSTQTLIHWDNGVHLSTIEQMILSKAKISTKYLAATNLQSYIAN